MGCKHKDCKYRIGANKSVPQCAYMLYTGTSRNCSSNQCTKYIKGKRVYKDTAFGGQFNFKDFK